MREPWLMALQVPAMSSGAPSSSSTTESSVRAMFVPVSPSGTGYTLRRLIAAWWSATSRSRHDVARSVPAELGRASPAPRIGLVTVRGRRRGWGPGDRRGRGPVAWSDLESFHRREARPDGISM